MANDGKSGGGVAADNSAKTLVGGGDSKSLRDWAEPSYDVSNGRSASSLQAAGNGSKGNHTGNVSDQIGTANRGGEKGAPGVSALNRSGSGDPGRRKWGGSTPA